MVKIYVLIVVILACGWGYNHHRRVIVENDFERLETNYNALMGNKMFLEKELDERNEKMLETSKRVCQIEERAEEAKDKGGFDWNTSLPNDGVTHQLHKD